MPLWGRCLGAVGPSTPQLQGKVLLSRATLLLLRVTALLLLRVVTALLRLRVVTALLLLLRVVTALLLLLRVTHSGDLQVCKTVRFPAFASRLLAPLGGWKASCVR
jgi:hypothetical protein